MPKRKLIIASWILLFSAVGFAFNNCSKPQNTISNQRTPTNNLIDPIVENCVIQGFNTSSKVQALNNPFDDNKLVTAESDSEDYVAIVSPECLNDPALRARSTFSERMGMQDGPQGHRTWTKKIQRGELPDSMSDLQNEIDEDPCLVSLSPNRKYRLNLAVSEFDDTFLPQSNHLDSVNFFESIPTFYHPSLGLQETAGAPRVRVAVIDTGAFYDHPDLTENIYRGPNGVGVDANTLGTGNVNYDGIDVDPAVSHGTHVSGIIAARGANGIGVTGLAPQSVQILPINVFYRENPNDNTVISDTATLVRGINFAIAENADVINMSLGGGGDDPALLAALQSAVANGIFVVAAAANEGREIGDDFQTYPAYYASQITGMVAVGSVNANDKSRSSFSNFGPSFVEIAAPGAESEVGTDITGIASTFDQGNYARLFGTSQAAPMVSAAAAVAEGLIRQNGQSITPAQMETLLLASAEKRTNLTAFFRSGNVLNLHRLAAFVNANFQGTGMIAFNSVCQI